VDDPWFDSIEGGEVLIFDFDEVLYPLGVSNITLDYYYGQNNGPADGQAFFYTAANATGVPVATIDLTDFGGNNNNGSQAFNNPSIENIRSIKISVIDQDSYYSVTDITFDAVTAYTIFTGDNGNTNVGVPFNNSSDPNFIEGLAGNDNLFGGLGADVFAWGQRHDDDGSGGAATDTIIDFNLAQGDALDLSDLLIDEENGALADYLSFTISGASDVLEIDPDGAGAGGVTQNITFFNNNDLTSIGTGTDAEIISALLAGNHLIVD
jgi:hypothetical protein